MKKNAIHKLAMIMAWILPAVAFIAPLIFYLFVSQKFGNSCSCSGEINPNIPYDPTAPVFDCGCLAFRFHPSYLIGPAISALFMAGIAYLSMKKPLFGSIIYGLMGIGPVAITVFIMSIPDASILDYTFPLFLAIYFLTLSFLLKRDNQNRGKSEKIINKEEIINNTNEKS